MGRPVRSGLHPPPRSPALNEISWRSPNTRDFARAHRPASSLCKEEGPLRGCLGLCVSGVRKPFPGALERRGQRLGSHATETGLHARVSRGIGTRWSARNFRPYCGIALLLVRSADGATPTKYTRLVGSIPSMRPVREPTSRTCDFHIRIKPSYPSFRTARGMTDGLPAHQSSPLQSAIHGRFANGRS